MDFSYYWLRNVLCFLEWCPWEKISLQMGVRQGDHLSPLIFVRAADLLQSDVHKAPCSPYFGTDYLVVKYVYDTIVIMLACPQQIIVTKQICETYANSTCLQINYHKSVMIPINMNGQRAIDTYVYMGLMLDQ